MSFQINLAFWSILGFIGFGGLSLVYYMCLEVLLWGCIYIYVFSIMFVYSCIAQAVAVGIAKKSQSLSRDPSPVYVCVLLYSPSRIAAGRRVTTRSFVAV